MRFMRFSTKRRLTVVRARLYGPETSVVIRLAVDTGASVTSIRNELLELVGYDLSMVLNRARIVTGTQVEVVPRLSIARIAALKQERENLVVVAHTLPPSAGVDGLLGLDFFQDQTLTINFRDGLITLE